MKKNFKKFLSLLLSVSMALSICMIPVSAAQPEDTTEENTVAAVSGVDQDEQDKVEIQQKKDAEEQKEGKTGQTQDVAVMQTEETEVTLPEEDAGQASEQAVPQTGETTTENQTNVVAEANVSESNDILKDFDIDVSKIKVPHINVNEPLVTTYAEIDESDPQIKTFRAELEAAEVTDEDTNEKVPLTEEQIQTALGMFQQYIDFREQNADVLGVQNPFYLQFNDNNEDGLGVLGEMLTLAGVSVEDVRNGDYSYDELLGMILNFQYGDSLGVQYYGNVVEEKRDEALKTVEDSGAQTDEQKLLVLNTWLAQNNTFDMSYIMNQMDPSKPVMVAEDPQQNEHYDDIYAEVEAFYRPQIEGQFTDQFQGIAQQTVAGQYKAQIALVLWQQEIQTAAEEEYRSEHPKATEEEITAYVTQFMSDNAEAIQTDAKAFASEQFSENAAAEMEERVNTQSDEQVNAYLATEDGIAAVDQCYRALMNTKIPDLGDITPNEAIEVYVKQAADGLTNGIIGYWEGMQIGALAGGASVCMGYAKAYAYLIQCMYPEYYLKDGETDISVGSNWKTPEEIYYDENGNLDINEDYNVDLVRISFNASVKMYGIPQPDFSSDHFWNAVKVNGKWYYIDPCYIDVFSEVMNRDRVETDGFMNHIYFLISHTSIAEMFAGNYSEIKTLYEDVATDQSYEGTWVSRIASNVYTDDNGYAYYMYDSTDLLNLLREFNQNEGNYQDMEIDKSIYKLVRHKMTANDLTSQDGDTDYETLIDFNSGEKVTVLQNGEMVENDMLTKLYAQFQEEQEVYPAIHITPVLSGGKLYFNISNCIISYDLTTGDVVKVKEYNTVYAERNPQIVFGAMAFSATDDKENADFTFENHPIAGMCLKTDGNLYVDIATNLSYIAGKDPHDYMDTSSYGYEFEESNYNTAYTEYAEQMMADQGFDESMIEQMGYKLEKNDNAEFMWVANVIDTMDMAHFGGDSHSYAEVTVAPFCGRDGFTENRCTECGAVEAGSCVTEEGTACDHHYLHFEEEYYTTDDEVAADTDPDTVNWNTGESYVCAMCGFSISEPTEPKENQYVSEEEYQQLLEQYEKDKAIYDEAVATAGHTYVPTDAVWTDDPNNATAQVTFSGLECNSVCPERKNALDLLKDDNSVSVDLGSEESWSSTEYDVIGGNCEEGLSVVYKVVDAINGMKFTAVSDERKLAPGMHKYEGEFVWTPVKNEQGEVTGYKAVAPELTCEYCSNVVENFEVAGVKDENASRPASCEVAGVDVYVAETTNITNEAGEVIGVVENILPYETTLPATGHSWEVKSASETKIVYECRKCGETYTKELPVKDPEPDDNPDINQNPGTTPDTDQKPGVTPSTDGTQNVPNVGGEQSAMPAVGTILIDNATNGEYMVTLANSDVAYMGPVNKNVTVAAVPETITVNNRVYKVSSVADKAFKNNKMLKKVTIANNVKSIGNAAFQNCTKLKKITMPTTLKTIGKKAFYNCNKLKSVVIPKKVKTIGKKAFYNCKNLRSITVLTKKLTVKSVGNKAFTKAGSNNYGKLKVKVPSKKYSAYRTMLRDKGLSSRAKISR